MKLAYRIYAWCQRLRRFCRMVCEAAGSDALSHVALFDLDHKPKPYLDFAGGTFIEVGGNDGLTRTNSYWFERFRGWRGIPTGSPAQARHSAAPRIAPAHR